MGSLVGAVFGAIYVEANSGSLPMPVPIALRIAGAVAFVGLVVLIAVTRRPPTPSADKPGPSGRGGFGRGYWLIVAGEATAIVIGANVLTRVFDLPHAVLPHAVVAWVSVVVGVHFLALAAIWRLSLFRALGGAICLCGLGGLAAVGAGATNAAIAIIGGVGPGALLLAFAYWGAVDGRTHRRRASAGPFVPDR